MISLVIESSVGVEDRVLYDRLNQSTKCLICDDHLSPLLYLDHYDHCLKRLKNLIDSIYRIKSNNNNNNNRNNNNNDNSNSNNNNKRKKNDDTKEEIKEVNEEHRIESNSNHYFDNRFLMISLIPFISRSKEIKVSNLLMTCKSALKWRDRVVYYEPHIVESEEMVNSYRYLEINDEYGWEFLRKFESKHLTHLGLYDIVHLYQEGIPKSVTHLYIHDDEDCYGYDSSEYLPGVFHEGLKYLNLDIARDDVDELEIQLPLSLEVVRLDTLSVTELPDGFIGPNCHTLTIPHELFKFLSLPNLVNLTLQVYLDDDIINIPSTVTSLCIKCGRGLEGVSIKIPSSVSTLSIDVPLPENVLKAIPSSVTHLIIDSFKLDQILPDSIVKLELGQVTKKGLKYPSRLTHLFIGTSYEGTLDLHVPPTLTHLYINSLYSKNGQSNSNFQIPGSITNLRINRMALQLDQLILPNGLTHLFLPSFKKRITDNTLPHSLTHLILPSFNQRITDNTLPHSLTHLTLSHSYSYPLQSSTLPLSLQSINFNEYPIDPTIIESIPSTIKLDYTPLVLDDIDDIFDLKEPKINFK